MKKVVYTVFAFLLLSSCALANPQSPFEVISEEETFIVRMIADDLSRPWSLGFLPDGQFLVTERTGELILLNPDRRVVVTGVPEAAVVGQGGLLDLALSPTFADDSLVYLSYAEESGGLYGTAVARGRLVGTDGSNPKLESVDVIYRALPKSSGGRHFGSRMVFDTEGYLYVTTGDRGSMDRAQDPDDPYGSVLRLNPDGAIPRDNPFASGGSNPGGGAAEVWSYGHRNPQGMAKHPSSGDIWLHEHGPKGGDEVNIVQGGANYGWPLTTYGIDYNGSVISNLTTAPGITDSVVHWTPSIAPSGMTFYAGRRFPAWSGDIFVGALAGKHLRRLELAGNRIVHQEILLQNRLGRIRDVRSGPDGYIYLLTDAENGALYRLEPQ